MTVFAFHNRRLYLIPLVIGLVLGLAMVSMAHAQSSVRPPDNAANAPADPGITAPLGALSDSDIWRQIKSGARAGSTVSVPDGVQLIQVLGEDWRLLRRDYIVKYSGWVLAGTLGLIALFYLLRGRIRIQGGRAGTSIARFSLSHRVAHWFLAGTSFFLGLTGLVILLGRTVLVPLIGKQANAVLASAALQAHNLFGPVFILALLIMIVRFMRGNFFQRADIKWILKGGGLIGGHASSNHYNFGEKSWYWIVVIIGLTMSASGWLLEFPWLSDTLMWHQLATVVHAIGAIVMISVALGHSYIGSIGMEGSLDSMLIGEVDENWAREHHDLWYEEVTGKPAQGTADATPSEGAA